MRNIRLLLAYDGTNYAGWQVQPERVTVQGTVEEAIWKLTGERVRILSAGRTDSGVHALGQVANFQTEFPIPPEKWRPALQAHLPDDIVIFESSEVPLSFHATFSAVSKRYRYVIHNRLVSDPFLRRYCWRISQELDEQAMHEAGQQLVGTYDFRSFESNWPNKATSVRTVSHLSVRRCHPWDVFIPRSLAESAQGPHPGFASGLFHPQSNAARNTQGEFICLEIEANGFLYNMVRAITGTLVYIGRGSWTEADLVRVRDAMDRSIAGGTAPALGLFMVQVNYGDATVMPSQGDTPAIDSPES